MEIKFKDNPITIKTIVVDNKKLTKQFLKQIYLDYPLFKRENDDDFDKINLTQILQLKYADYKEYNFIGQIIGWINFNLENDDIIRTKYFIKDTNINNFTLILFIDNEGELKRAYIQNTVFNNLMADKYPQIFI